jgi:SET domain-containing protein
MLYLARSLKPDDEAGMATKKRTKRPFEARRSKIQGHGVFATRKIPEGTVLVEYTGEVISEDEADERYPMEDEERHHTFLFRLDSGDVIDAGPRGSIAKYINHSCDPNCEAFEEDGRIFIESIRDIRKGEELVYDYNFVLDEPHNAANKKIYPCNCGAKKCRGTILAKKR